MLSLKDKFEEISEQLSEQTDEESEEILDEILDEIREQLSAQLNENIEVDSISNTLYVVDNKNQITIKINKGNTHKLESTKIIQIYNELREFKNNINKQFNLNCRIEKYYSNELIEYISIKYDKNNIEAINYIELTEKVKKIEELKNQILSFGKKLKNQILSFSKKLKKKSNINFYFNFSSTYDNNTIEIQINNIVDKVIINFNNNITKFIDIYNEIRKYRSSINKEFNLDCNIEIYYDINELIQSISIKYDKNNIEATNYIELTKKLKKIEEFKNKILSVKIDKDFKFNISHSDKDVYTNIVLTNIINNTRISIKYNIIETFEIYNQLSEYLNINSNEWIDYNCDIIMSSYKEDSITVNCFNNGCLNTVNYSVYDRFNISINNKNIISIIKISNEVKKYIKSIECNKKPIIYNFYAKYDENIVENIHLILEDSNGDKIRIEANNYIELTRKIQLEPEERLKEKIEIMALELSKQLKEDIIVKDITDNSFSILGEYTNTEYKIKINVKYYDIIDINIGKIYNEVKNKIIHKYVVSHIEINYYYYSITKITLKYNDCIFSGNSCIECNKKIEEYIKEQEKAQENAPLKLKYGDKTDLLKSFNHIEISYVDIEYIDLLDFIPYNKEKIICDGKITDIFKSNERISSITIKNCVNLKKINNYVFERIENYERGSLLNGFNNTSIFKNINIKIINCPKLEFIEYYDKFIITIDDKMVYRIKQDDLSKIKEENSEIKSLLKDQQEYAHIIQSLLKRINKLENKAVENE
jgi:hypothetical protein